MTANHYSFHLRTMWLSVSETVPIGVATPASKHIGVVGASLRGLFPADDDVRFCRILEAYEQALHTLCVKDRDDPLTEMFAKKIIKIAQTGVHDAA